MRRLCSVLVSLVLVCFVDLTDSGPADGCNQTDFETLWAKTHGTVKWAIKDRAGVPGVVKCTKGYIFNGTEDLVYCPPGSETYALADPKGACIDDPFIDTKVVPFQGLTYNFTHIQVGSKTVNFPVLYPNTSYIITTQYTASKTTPTIRVRVGLVGKSHKPVLVNIQQSTESVGFELPMKVVGKGSKELAPLNDHTVELCPVSIKKDKDGKEIKVIETVQIILTGGGAPLTHKNAGGPYIQVHPSAVQHMELTPGKPMGPTNVDDRESLVYRYTWPEDDSIDKVDILVTHFEGDKGHIEGKGADVCAKISVRSGTCPIEEMGIHVLTFTRQAFITVSKHDERLKDVKDGFLVVIDVYPDDWKCTSDMDHPVNNGRTKSVQVQLTESPETLTGVYLIFPIMTCVFLVILTGLVLFLFIRPLSNVISEIHNMDEVELKTLVDDDDELVDADDTRALVVADDPPPFDKQEEYMPKKVDLEEVEFGVPEEDSEANSDQEPGPSAQDSDELLNHLFNLGASAGPNVAGDGVLNFKGIWNKVKRNELVVNITQTIGHCSVPLLVFLNSFDSTFIDITGNLKEHTENGDLDACYVNSRCAYAGKI
ncbi:uncharacterized protein LOC134814515 isoform X2 [Bolinopsis microptera]|uniref:uncharacterized protein LOC134814515 isoform X2 n=1 Tax=Bolinopsis microptera TaxID=2820187 RepID=UPI003079BDF5